MTRQAYIDESQRGGTYVLAAFAVRHGSVDEVRKKLRAQAPRDGRGRLHFVKESPRSRRQLLEVYRSLPGTDVTVYTVTWRGPAIEQRRKAMTFLVEHLIEHGGLTRLVLDHVEPTQQARDRQVLAPIFRANGLEVDYHHEPPKTSEPMLWVPDAAAWCSGLSEWRRELAGWVELLEA